MDKIIAKAEHKNKGTKAIVIGIIVSVVTAIIGFSFSYSASYGTFIQFFSLLLFQKRIDETDKIPSWEKGWDLGLGFLCIVLCLLLPQIIIFSKRAICDKQAGLTSLHVDADKIYGSFGNSSKKEMIIPIEQLDNVIVTYAFADKLRSGKTITLCSASGKIKFHYIQNAEEVSTAILDKINDYKKNYGNAAKSTVIENTIQSSNADELKKYKDLLDSGAITQEEYDTKKKQILGL